MTIVSIDTNKVLANAAKSGRISRKPSHDFNLHTMPWAIQPFVIAPVLPGETMTNALLQARTVSDPVKSPLMGWWNEFYLFYVKLRDLEERDHLTNMILTPGYDTSPLNYTGESDFGGWDTNTGHHGYGGPRINYPRMCLKRVVDEYFRDEGDNPPWLDKFDTRPGLPPATIQTREYWHQSAKLHSSIPNVAKDRLPGEELLLASEDIPAGFEAHWQQWQHMRALELTTVTFEDWLAQFGVRTPKAQDIEESHRPELIRYIRDWSYPTNHIDPTTGEPSSALSWSTAERADKDRFFKEPGFLFGVQVTRPKIYLGKQYAAAVSMLNDSYSWLPAVLDADPYTSLKRFAGDKGPLGYPGGNGPSEDYWVDVRDLFLYGDSMFNFRHDSEPDADQTGRINMLALPDAGLKKRYATDAQAKALFKYADKFRIRTDGVINFNILGRQRDHT